MSALFRAEIASLLRLVAHQETLQALDTNERERIRTSRAASEAADRQAVADVLSAADRPMTSTEIANRAGVSRQRAERILDQLCAARKATRRRGAVRRDDGQGYRNSFRYRATK